MSQKIKALIVVFVVLVAGFVIFRPVFDQQQVPLHKRISDYQGVFEAARAEGRPIFIEFYSEA